MQVVSVPISDIKVNFRLRNTSEDKVSELAKSISECSLINPITLDKSFHLICGHHRLMAFKQLKLKEIPSIIKEVDENYYKLMEISENLFRANLTEIQSGDHIVLRENIMDKLGLLYKSGDNRNTMDDEKFSVKDLAEGIGYSRRSYQLRKQISLKLHPEVKDLLGDTEYANSLVELVKLSSEPDHIQMQVAKLLITGSCKTWKTAFYEAKLADFRLNSVHKIDFNIKERWGDFPQSIMTFDRMPNHDLTKVINLINHHDDLRPQKGETNFGQPIKLHQMNPQQCLFSLDYYTQPGWTIADPFNGRGTTAITSLYLKRKFIGWEINPTSYKKTKEVIRDHMNVSEDDWEIHEGCGCEMDAVKDQSEILDAVFTSPPYYWKAEPYANSENDPRDLCNMSIEEFDSKIDEMFGNLSRLLKKSDYKKKIFHPAIFVVGTARKSDLGIQDMSFSFQAIAKKWKFTLWDQMFVKLNNPHLCTSLQRNYELKFVQKNYESQLCFVKF